MKSAKREDHIEKLQPLFNFLLLSVLGSVRGLFALAEYDYFRFRFLEKICKKTKTSCTSIITCINRIIIKVCKK